MAQRAVRYKVIPIRLAYEAFRVSESCYRYQAKNNAENEVIANWLIREGINGHSMSVGVAQDLVSRCKSSTNYGQGRLGGK